ncbi:MAG TPA: hypothetical protein VK088_05735, partial [Acidimicrobiia bacterium]|nr:hypothetical protein [Acidimicrobiia bacterium]
LNLPPEDKRADGGMYSEAEVWERTRWPVPFYEDSDGWPCSLLDFHPVAKCVWPMAHFKPALGEMMAANWIYSFLLGRLHFTSRTLIFYADHLGEEIKAALESGKDLELIPYQEALVKEIDKLVQQFQHAPVPMDLWRILAELNILIDKRTGLSETLYGMTDTQPRSATESQVRQSASNIRPASMADTVEDWQTKVARAEAFMSRLKVPGNVVSAYMGETGPMGKGLFGELWDRFVYLPLDYTQPQNTARAALEFEYTIAAGSSRKPNLERDQVNMDQAMQTMLPMAETERQMTGDPTMTNWLLSQWAKSRQIEAPLFPDRTAEIAMQQQMAAEQAAQMPVDETGQPMVAA